MARRGRRPDPNARRHRTTRAGRRPPPDRGTPELTAKRALVVGADGAHDPRAGDPLGILCLDGQIVRAQMDAGWLYAVLRWRAFGRPTPYTPVYRMQLAGFEACFGGLAAGYPEADARVRDLFERGDNVLRNAGRLAWSETRRVAVEHRLPVWYWRARAGTMGAEDAIERAALLRGLDALAGAYGMGARVSGRRTRARIP